MKFELWRGVSGSVALAEALEPSERGVLEDLGYECIHGFEVADEQAASSYFIDWCHKQQPDAKVVPVDKEQLQGAFADSLN